MILLTDRLGEGSEWPAPSRAAAFAPFLLALKGKVLVHPGFGLQAQLLLAQMNAHFLGPGLSVVLFIRLPRAAFPVQGESCHGNHHIRGLGYKVLSTTAGRERGDSGQGDQSLGQVLQHMGEDAKSRVKALKGRKKDNSPVRECGTLMGEGPHWEGTDHTWA